LPDPAAIAPEVISAHGNPSTGYPVNNGQAMHSQHHLERKWDYAGYQPVSAMNILAAAL
jgi:hypothetical protein